MLNFLFLFIFVFIGYVCSLVIFIINARHSYMIRYTSDKAALNYESRLFFSQVLPLMSPTLINNGSFILGILGVLQPLNFQPTLKFEESDLIESPTQAKLPVNMNKESSVKFKYSYGTGVICERGRGMLTLPSHSPKVSAAVPAIMNVNNPVGVVTMVNSNNVVLNNQLVSTTMAASAGNQINPAVVVTSVIGTNVSNNTISAAPAVMNVSNPMAAASVFGSNNSFFNNQKVLIRAPVSVVMNNSSPGVVEEGKNLIPSI